MKKNNLIIQSRKCDAFEDAWIQSLAIMNYESEEIGKLVPIGSWILSASEKIEQMAQWRNKYMNMFFSQFIATFEGTKNYLAKTSVGDENRLLFGIFSQEQNFIGHIGVIIKNNILELDNVIRGVQVEKKNLMYFAGISIIDWCRKNMDVSPIYILHVFSHNSAAINLYTKMDFIFTDEFFLRKIEKKDCVTHEVVANETHSNVPYRYFRMCLDNS